ncbi:uncharacterized protein LOC123353061 isoform X1 [Mauremys mutica]|uniref:uncharacterized protein LOC123353061 isoform X1 n=1 Tax=Mauremys mutica TaxID=74926 RepID=UPI001D1667B3|nr:uncharacterized protein LOC123353061 isoform X1 [Mauremys mutica]
MNSPQLSPSCIIGCLAFLCQVCSAEWLFRRLLQGVCSDLVWLPSSPAEGVPLQTPKWAEPPPPVPAPGSQGAGQEVEKLAAGAQSGPSHHREQTCRQELATRKPLGPEAVARTGRSFPAPAMRRSRRSLPAPVTGRSRWSFPTPTTRRSRWSLPVPAVTRRSRLSPPGWTSLRSCRTCHQAPVERNLCWWTGLGLIPWTSTKRKEVTCQSLLSSHNGKRARVTRPRALLMRCKSRPSVSGTATTPCEISVWFGGCSAHGPPPGRDTPLARAGFVRKGS